MREFCPEGGGGEGEGERAGERAEDGAAEYGALMEQLARMRYCAASFYLYFICGRDSDLTNRIARIKFQT